MAGGVVEVRTRKNLTVRVSVDIAASPEATWDYTQDWTRRTEWDALIVQATIVEAAPKRVVQVVARGAEFTVRYKLVDRPHKTSLLMTDVKSLFFSSGGGSWTYEPNLDGGTTWTQTNTIVLRSAFLSLLFGWLFRWQLAYATRRAMLSAKKILTSSSA